MTTININNNTVVVQTAAQWAVDATVYTNKQILVTSDAFWGSTDQRRFKIADGVQTWANLDYPPFKTGDNTLSEVLTAGNTTGGQAITGDSGELFLIVNDAIALLGYDAGAGVTSNVSASSTHAQIDFAGATYTGFVEVQDTKTEVQHDNLIELDAPSVRLVQETASRVAIIDASKDIVGADTATYPDLPELARLKGVTSPIQTQFNNITGGNVSFKRISGYWYTSAVTNFQASTAALSKDIIRLTPFIVSETESFNRIAMEVSSGGTAGSLIRLGIYSSSGGYPTTNLLNAGTIAGDSATNQTITISQTLTPGVYWLAYVHNSTASISFRTIPASFSAIPAVLGIKDGTFTGNQYNLIEMSYTYDGTFPTISGASLSGLNVAIVALRKA